MYLLKKSILKSFGACVAALGLASFAAVVYILAAQGLAEIDHLERYALLHDLVIIEQFLLQPAVSFLHANAPLFYEGLDLAPYLIAVALIVLWATCESERHRLRVMDWDLEAERSAARAAGIAARERARAAARQAELARLHERESARLVA
jgi:hypothetical protein